MTAGRRFRQSNTANLLLGIAGEPPALRGFGVAVKRLVIFGSGLVPEAVNGCQAA